jgi:hypothetical protein
VPVDVPVSSALVDPGELAEAVAAVDGAVDYMR